jgi:hypothetical protein
MFLVNTAQGDLSSRIMSPEAGFDLQIARYIEMIPEQRVSIALWLHELACEMARLGIRQRHPHADADEVERLLRERLQGAP